MCIRKSCQSIECELHTTHHDRRRRHRPEPSTRLRSVKYLLWRVLAIMGDDTRPPLSSFLSSPARRVRVCAWHMCVRLWLNIHTNAARTHARTHMRFRAMRSAVVWIFQPRIRWCDAAASTPATPRRFPARRRLVCFTTVVVALSSVYPPEPERARRRRAVRAIASSLPPPSSSSSSLMRRVAIVDGGRRHSLFV